MRLILAAVVTVALGALWFYHSGHERSGSYRTSPVKLGNLEAAISATGTVEPEEVVDVGAQVAGKILAFGKDQSGRTIDYGSVVEEGTVLAKIDDALYSAEVAQIGAQLDQSRAGVLRAEADLAQLQAKLSQADREWVRAKKLGPSDALSRSDYDSAQSAYEVAKANVAVGNASIVQAKKTVAQAEASLKKARQNLDYCTIQSPVKGVIIDRRVNIGQTVVASLNAPSLFLIAKDLKRLQVWIAVNEADIGSIHPGQRVTFTIDAYPGEAFQGEVGKVRLNATMTQNVVTYTVEVTTDNSSGKLLPYLTANAKFIISSHSNVLMVPNAALRWTPPSAPAAQAGKAGSKPRTGGQDVAQNSGNTPPGKEASSSGTVWVLQGDSPRPVSVKLGPTDGSFTMVESQELKEGMEAVIGEERKEATVSSQAPSPFTPQLPGGPRR